MTEETYMPNESGTYPKDTVPEDTTVTTLNDDDTTELVNAIKNSRVVKPEELSTTELHELGYNF